MRKIICRISEERKEWLFEDGTLRTVEDLKTGEVTLYWPNGQTKRKCSFVKGVRHGLDQMWSEEGKLLDEDRYEYGKKL